MRICPCRLFFGLAVVLSLASASWGAGARKAYDEDEASLGTTGWFVRPVADTPMDQLAHADALAEKGRLARAERAYRALVNRWPREPEAAVAQHKRAILLRRRGKLKEAFEAFQRLIEVYPGQFAYEEVLQAQFDVAVEVMNQRRGKFLVFPGFAAPERALEMLAQVVENGPRWARAAEAQYLQGTIREKNFEHELAVLDYTETLLRYPDSAFAEPAALGRARTLVRLSDESPHDTAAAWEAWYALSLFNTTYPDSDLRSEADGYARHIYDRLARGAYDIAVYYDRTADQAAAALSAYESFVRRFPGSRWTAEANRRISELKPVVENAREAP